MNPDPLPISPNTTQSSKKIAVYALMGICIVLVLLCFGLLYALYAASTDTTPIATTTKTSVVKPIILPKEAIKISECVPLMGEHWVEVKNIPEGPFYTVNKGVVVGIEYMFSEDTVKGQKFAEQSPAQVGAYMKTHNYALVDLLRDIEKVYPIPNASFKEWAISWTPPHAGFVVPHYDVHLYLVDKKVRETICPNATESDTLPPDLAADLQKRGIAIPGAPEKKATQPQLSPTVTK